jgi:glycosyltransferase involved in cell wall biosynthesis
MRVLYLSSSYTTHDRRFLSEIALAGHDVYFLTLDDSRPGWERRAVPSGVRRLAWPDTRRDARALRRLADRIKPDVVHASPILTSSFLAAQAGLRPLVSMSWGSDILIDAGKTADSRRRTHVALSCSDAFVCDCRTVLQKARRFAAIPSRRVLMFPWGVDLSRFKPGPDALKLRTRWAPDAVILLSTRSWEPLYGTDVLLEGFARARAKDRRLTLMLLGAGSLEHKLEALIRRHKIEDAVLRPGIVGHDDLPDYFRAADIYVGCAYSDGTSVSLLEAMASGVAPVVPDIPSNREWVTRSRGRLFTPGDPASLANVLLDLAARQHLWPEMARANRAACRQRADWRRNIRLLVNAYARLGTRR